MAEVEIAHSYRSVWPNCKRCGHSWLSHMTPSNDWRTPGSVYPCEINLRRSKAPDARCTCSDYQFTMPEPVGYHRVRIMSPLVIVLDMQ